MSDAYVLDASAILCLPFAEPGAAEVERRRPDAVVGAVNLAEVVSKLVERGASDVLARDAVAALNLVAVPLDRETAEAAGLMRVATRHAGLSLGDRCCLEQPDQAALNLNWSEFAEGESALALAARTGRIAATTDRAWAKVQVGVAIEILR